jgi:hypothetical protein
VKPSVVLRHVIAAFLTLALGSAWADRGRAAKPDSSLRKTQVVDLDLTLGQDEEQASMGTGPNPRSTTWYYWAAAGATIAAGGLGLYWYEDRAKTSGTSNRNEQVFTDEP